MVATNVLKNTIYWGWALVWAEVLSEWMVSWMVKWISAKVSAILSWVKWWQFINANLPVVWALAPFALWWYALKKWLKEEKIYNKVEKTALTYWWIWTATAVLWLLSVPFSSWMLATWAWMYWVKKIASVIKETFTSIKSINPVDYTIKGIKWIWTWIKKWWSFLHKSFIK